MENNKKEKVVYYAYNIGVKNKESKVEVDTIFTHKLLNEDDVKEMSKLVKADVMITLYGKVMPFNEKMQEKNSFVELYKKEEEVQDE